MKNSISKSNNIILGISALFFLLFSLTSCNKAEIDVIPFSEMSFVEKEDYSRRLLESEEYRTYRVNLNWFIPISIVALNDERLHQAQTKEELMAWVKDNLEHTLFRSVAEAEMKYNELDRSVKVIRQKFSAMDFKQGSPDIYFFNDYVARLYEIRVEKTYPQRKSYGNCKDAFDECMAQARKKHDDERRRCAATFSENTPQNIKDYTKCKNDAVATLKAECKACRKTFNDCLVKL